MVECSKCGKITSEITYEKYEGLCEDCYIKEEGKQFLGGCGLAAIAVPLTVFIIGCAIGTVTCAIGLPEWVTETWQQWLYSILFGIGTILSSYFWIRIIKVSAKKMKLGEANL
ncbi:MAG TPA: hypothetical protein VMX55_01805 [candidate division Zixibacteria bacterium]|nr:hypothetical protein [candidate division Zixibacteria bacterium]